MGQKVNPHGLRVGVIKERDGVGRLCRALVNKHKDAVLHLGHQFGKDYVIHRERLFSLSVIHSGYKGFGRVIINSSIGCDKVGYNENLPADFTRGVIPSREGHCSANGRHSRV